jgi:hypothetical protein
MFGQFSALSDKSRYQFADSARDPEFMEWSRGRDTSVNTITDKADDYAPEKKHEFSALATQGARRLLGSVR